jgi:hypothetical protein
MINYKLYDINSIVQASIRSDIDRIITIISHYNKEIYYRNDKFYTEFIFRGFKFLKENTIYIDRIFRQTTKALRLGKTIDGDLIVVIEKFPLIFMNR